MTGRLYCLFAALIMLVGSSTGEASSQTLVQMYHRSWTQKDGVPDSIWRIAQTTDGFLWLSGDSGLYRFDGTHFQRLTSARDGLLSDYVTALFASRNGGLWIGYRSGGISYLKDGTIRSYPVQQNDTHAGVLYFAELSDGTLWVGTTGGITRFENGRFIHPDKQSGYISDRAVELSTDSEDTVWVFSITANRLQYLPKGARHFMQLPMLVGDGGMAEAAAGRFWTMNDNGLVVLERNSQGQWNTTDIGIRGTFGRPTVDQEGDLWFATETKGIQRIPRSALHSPFPLASTLVDHFDRANGLTSNLVLRIYPDREKGVWVITNSGLDYFRRAAFSPLSLPFEARHIAMGQSSSGAIYLASSAMDHIFAIVSNERVLRLPNPPPVVGCMYQDGTGQLWVGSNEHISRLVNGRLERVASFPPYKGSEHDVQALAVGPDGVLWVAAANAPPMKFDHGTWSAIPSLGSGPLSSASAVLVRLSGEVWFGLPDRVAILREGQTEFLTSEHGVHVGKVSTLVENGGHVWIGGSEGLALYQNGGLRTVASAIPDQIVRISGIAETPKGDLWLNTTFGAIRVSSGEIRKLLSNPRYQVAASKFDVLDNFPGTPSEQRPLPSILQAADGRLYFSGKDGVSWLNPNNLPYDTFVPGVAIDEVNADGLIVPTDSTQKLLPKTETVRIRFAVGTTYIPERASAKYRLEGFDTSWIEAGQAREAIYRNLPPGHYIFRVAGINASGITGATDTTFAFSIPPTFLQSKWFVFICCCVTAVLIWLAFRLRVRYVTNRMEEEQLVRMQERTRIARELHDRFLPGIQGIFLQLKARIDRLSPLTPEKGEIEEALSYSDGVVLDGRNLIQELREESYDGLLSAYLKELRKKDEMEDRIPIKVSLEGKEQRLGSKAFEEVSAIVHEAVRNAERHSSAKLISIRVSFSSRVLEIKIVDDGRGIPKDVLAQSSHDGHWGIQGMRERAKLLHATLHIASSETGTEVTLRAPNRGLQRSNAKWILSRTRHPS